MHIYAFGSVCRGDLSRDSDVDLLAIVDGRDDRLSPDVYSIYSYKRMCELWQEGNPFAWHLSLEAKLLFSPDKSDVLGSMGPPEPYRNGLRDCEKFYALFRAARDSLLDNKLSTTFDLSTMFLSIRNIATCFSLGFLQKPTFARHSASRLGRFSLPLQEGPYAVLERARILCTRGFGSKIGEEEVDTVIGEVALIEDWMKGLMSEARRHA